MPAGALDFTGHADKVRKIFEKYDHWDDRVEHNRAIKAQDEIEAVVNSIEPQVTQETPFEAKQQALEAFVEIADMFFRTQGGPEPSSIIRKDLRKDLYYWMHPKSTIRRLLDMLLPEELAALQADGEIAKAISNLRWHADAFAIDLEINDSVDRLWLVESDQEDDAEMAL